MSEEKKKKSSLARISENPGMFTNLSRTARLVLRLIADKRVNFFLKLLPIGTLVYMLSPFDAAVPVVDDAVIIGLGTYVFIELCPFEIVEEHRTAIAKLASAAPEPPQENGEVIDALFHDQKDKQE